MSWMVIDKVMIRSFGCWFHQCKPKLYEFIHFKAMITYFNLNILLCCKFVGAQKIRVEGSRNRIMGLAKLSKRWISLHFYTTFFPKISKNSLKRRIILCTFGPKACPQLPNIGKTSLQLQVQFWGLPFPNNPRKVGA